MDDAETLRRIRSLVIPPAWADVWICPSEQGHLQAVGTDAAGRRQYHYHDRWNQRRREGKHDRMLAFASRLPRARAKVDSDITLRGMPKARALAVAFRLLDHGFFRIGSESYCAEHGTFGLATLRRDHVAVRGDISRFNYLGKGGITHDQRLIDAGLAGAIRTLQRRNDPGVELLAWRDRHAWHDIRSRDINDYIRGTMHADFTAKDFRTWGATVLMAQALAVSQNLPEAVSTRRRAIARGMNEVAGYLGNTPAVARRSYVDPRVVDLYLDGVAVNLSTVDRGIGGSGLAIHGPLEQAVIALLREPRRRSRAA